MCQIRNSYPLCIQWTNEQPKEQPKALITNSDGHSPSLSIKDANKQCRILNETTGTAYKIIMLIKFSQNAIECVGRSTKTSKYRVMVIMKFLRK